MPSLGHGLGYWTAVVLAAPTSLSEPARWALVARFTDCGVGRAASPGDTAWDRSSVAADLRPSVVPPPAAEGGSSSPPFTAPARSRSPCQQSTTLRLSSEGAWPPRA